MSETTPEDNSLDTAQPKPLNYAPPPPQPHRVRRWMRETFTREQILSGFKQLMWVAPLTVLIWIYAEREQQFSVSDVRFAVELRSNNPKVAVRLIDPADGTVSIDLTGPRNEVDKLKSDLGTRSSAVRFDVPADLKEGTHQIPLSSVVNRDERFDGMTVRNPAPSRITVLVDPIQEEAVTIQLREEDNALFDAPVFNPPKVKVRMPRTVMTSARDKSGGRLMVYADLAALPDKTPGKKTDVSGVRVYVANADADESTIEPSTVTASYQLLEQTDDYTIRELPIRPDAANELLNQVAVKFDPINLFSVRLVGKPSAIAAVKDSHDAIVGAFVRIDPDDRDQTRVKDVKFWLPEGVKLHPKEPKRTVQVTVTSRTASP